MPHLDSIHEVPAVRSWATIDRRSAASLNRVSISDGSRDIFLFVSTPLPGELMADKISRSPPNCGRAPEDGSNQKNPADPAEVDW